MQLNWRFKEEKWGLKHKNIGNLEFDSTCMNLDRKDVTFSAEDPNLSNLLRYHFV